MKTNFDAERGDALLDALLRDENWQAASSAFKAEALRTFRVRQRVRRLTRWAGGVAALVTAIAGIAYWFGAGAKAPGPIRVAHLEVPKAPDKLRYLTDEELLAKFPKGSCCIAEVDGKKELIFFDPKAERTYMAQPTGRGN